ncbi:hypothetical protein GGR26_000462 [Lewinella marina]|uniref:hypothetical protein n=1 Tax=Neolewinella marina TaxID=438751 RepID=UPI00143153EC|nr:hypothetical protein [Neolewinella marina]NJB84717.1 hypothetical protein [Neolewinella marina]
MRNTVPKYLIRLLLLAALLLVVYLSFDRDAIVRGFRDGQGRAPAAAGARAN